MSENEGRRYHPVPVPGEEPLAGVQILVTDAELEAMKEVADAILAERTAAMLSRRYPAARPGSLELVISELSSFARAMRRRAEAAPAPGQYCCLRPDCTHERDQVFNGGGGE